MEQVHGRNIYRLREDERGEIIAPKSDGIIFHKDCRVAVGVRTADCQSVFAYNKGELIGIFHAGWRSLALDIGSCFVKEASGMGARVCDLEFEAGPHICSGCYSVGKELFKYFPNKTIKNSKLDLFAALSFQLQNSGIRAEKIRRALKEESCSYENESFFSHRRGDCGRMLAFAIHY